MELRSFFDAYRNRKPQKNSGARNDAHMVICVLRECTVWAILRPMAHHERDLDV